jgi:flagellar motor switch protein FliN/FliY
MDGMLSQDEINALLSGVNAGSSDPQPDPQPAATEEILTDIEKDAIGEIANISMGTSATTLYSLVNRKVNITTPTVSIANWKNFIDEQEKPCVFIQIKYTEGLDGANILIMRERDVKVITDLMMGGDGSNIDGELGELHLSAISEAMNQMMGSSATSLSSMLGRMIDISPPEASLVNILENKNGADIAPFLAGDFVKIEFRMQIEDLVDSTIMQLYPIDFAKSLYKIFMDQQMGTSAAPAQPDPAPQPQSVPAPQPQPDPAPQPQPYVPPQAEMPQMQQAMPQMQQANIQPAQFQAFNTQMPQQMASQENIGLIMDVPLEVTVELGRTKKSIAEILDFTPGTIIELDKIAGEPIDVLVNGKFVAKGEVVVIEESFGIRVTEIIK